MTSHSSVSVQKISDQRSKSCDTVCSCNSGCFLQRRKPVHPLATGVKASLTHTTTKSNVRQRVLSAKLLKLRSLQSQLNDASFHLAELARENQALKILQQRQDKALARYEGTNADLPRLLKAHSEEVRMLTDKNKHLRKNVKELTDLLKNRDDELSNTKRQLEHLEKLNKNKHLGERQKLSDHVEDLKQQLEKADSQISTLNRKIMLEGKSSKQKLYTENSKHKQCQKNLMQALSEIERLTSLVDIKNVEKLNVKKKTSDRQFKSMTHLDKICNTSHSNEGTPRIKPNSSPPASTRNPKTLNSFKNKSEESTREELAGIIKFPAENVIARLSSADPKKVSYETGPTDRNLESNSTEQVLRKSSLKSHSSQKLDKISSNLTNIIQKSKENGLTQFDKTLGNYCNHVISTVKACNKVVEEHQQSLDNSITDTETLRDAVEEIKQLDDQLKKSTLSSIDQTELNKLLKADYEIKKSKKDIATNKIDSNHSAKRDKFVRKEHKEKLLATLKAIDNGEMINSFDGDLMDDIYNGFPD